MTMAPHPQEQGASVAFVYEALPSRVIFGAGRLAEVATEVAELGGRRALVMATPPQADLAGRVADLLGASCVGVYDRAVQHVPHDTVTDAVARVLELDVDVLVAVGGGSTIGLAKGIALTLPLPILAVATTYAGSEMTPIWGMTRDGRKTTGRDPVVKPRTVIYDPELVVTLPAGPSLTSGMNAMAHAVEGLYAHDANPITSLLAQEALRALADGLPRVISDPTDVPARSDTLYGAWLAATVLSTVGMALHHKLCHTLGGTYGLPHAETHTVVLPHAAAYNAPAAPHAMTAMARALSCDPGDVPGVLYDLSADHGGPTSLAELGLSPDDIDECARIATQDPYANPRPVTREGIVALLTDAVQGVRP